MPRSALPVATLVLLGACLAVGLSACGGDDDDPVAPEPFAVVLEVVDAQGDPVAGLDVAVAPATPFYGEKAAADGDGPPLGAPHPNPFYPAVEVPFELDAAGLVRMSLEDVAGAPFRVLVDATLTDPGRHSWMWDGRDDAGAPAPSGIYHVRLEVRRPQDDALLHDDRRPLLLARLDPDHSGLGATDADGRLELRDRRLFPFLYDVPPFVAVDEAGDALGILTLTAAVRFVLADPTTGQFMSLERDVTGPGTLTVVWDPVR